jgi:hypothetical protein
MDNQMPLCLRRSARIQQRANNATAGKSKAPKTIPIDRPPIPSLSEFLAIRHAKLEVVRERPIILLLRKLKRDVQSTPSLWPFYTSLMRWLVTVDTSKQIDIEVWPEEVAYIPGYIRVIKTLDPVIVPTVIKPTRACDMHYVTFTIDACSATFDDCVLDSDHLFPEWPVCRPGFDILDAEW